MRLPRCCTDRVNKQKYALVKVCSVCPPRLSQFSVQPPSLSVPFQTIKSSAAPIPFPILFFFFFFNLVHGLYVYQ